MKDYYIIFVMACIVAVIVYLFVANPRTIETVRIDRDTIQTVDTVTITKTKVIERLLAVIDTVFIEQDTVIYAKADTLLIQDSSKIEVSYYFPPKNYFDINYNIKEKIIEKIKTITELKTVELSKMWYEDEWFYTSLCLAVILILENVYK